MLKPLVDPKTIDNMVVDLSVELAHTKKRQAAMLNASGQSAETLNLSVRIVRLNETLDALDALWKAYGWTRYIVVPDGHIHFDGCSTLRHDTLRSFLPDESGNTVPEMITKYGVLMCTVCFPNAPLDPAYQAAVRKTEEEKNAARAAKAAEQNAKDALTPKGDDGKALKVGWDSPKTERSARNLLAGRQYDMALYSRDGKQHPDHDKWAVESIRLARSIARLEGAEDVDARSKELVKAAAEKAAKKLAADIRKWNRENPNNQV